MGHVRIQLNTYVYIYLDSIEGTEYIADLFLVYMSCDNEEIWNRNSLSINVQFSTNIVLHELTRPLLMMRDWGINSLAMILLK